MANWRLTGLVLFVGCFVVLGRAVLSAGPAASGTDSSPSRVFGPAVAPPQ